MKSRAVLGRPVHVHVVVRVAAGVTAALLSMELGLRLFATADPVPYPRISVDSLGGQPVVRRQVLEGVATYRFSQGGSRLTGNPPLGAEPPVVILGDSYVVAIQVADNSTMGAQLESIARAHGAPLDARQYGWSNAAPAQYVLAAPTVLRRWNPQRVFVVLSDNDMDHSAQLASSARIRVGRDDSIRIVGRLMDTMPMNYPGGSVLYGLVRYRSGILGLRYKRKATGQRQQIVPDVGAPEELPPDSAEYAAIPGAVVRLLHQAYGSRLSIVYLASIGVPSMPSPAPTAIERALLDACAAQRVDCVSTRERMLAQSARHASYGTATARIGHGHLTPVGHGIVAGLMWERLRADR